MILLEISQSSYIFRQQIILHIVVIIICSGITAFLLVRLNKRLKTTKSKFQKIGWTILGVLITLAIYFTSFFPLIRKTLTLKNKGVEINGKTVRWINTNDSRMIEYSYLINGQTFKKICDVVYIGTEIPQIVCPGGNYIVICDIEDPDNSIMDFMRPSR